MSDLIGWQTLLTEAERALLSLHITDECEGTCAWAGLLRSLAALREEVAEMKAYWIHPDKADSVAFNLEGRARKAEIERDASRALVEEKDKVLRDVAMSRHLIECPTVGPTFEFCTEVLCQRSRTQLALTEADMLERLG